MGVNSSMSYIFVFSFAFYFYGFMNRIGGGAGNDREEGRRAHRRRPMICEILLVIANDSARTGGALRP